MGHAASRDVYRRLGDKVAGLAAQAPWNEALHSILKALYTAEEADLVVQMPFGLSSLDRIAAVTKTPPDRLRPLLEAMAEKGLVIDLAAGGVMHYAPNPIIVGFFEFTMMRTGDAAKAEDFARLFHAYLQDDPSYWKANLEGGAKVSYIRALPHEEAVASESFTEVLDYEKAAALIDENDVFSRGFCACRHTKHHLGVKKCDVPTETCNSFGIAADYIIRHGMGRRISREEMREGLERSREMGLVLLADNVKRNLTFLCHCCKCCCEAIGGITKFGYPNAVVTSNFIVARDEERCEGCAKCVRRCAVRAIRMQPAARSRGKNERNPRIDESLCLGCGVCALKCEQKALRLVPRKRRVFTPGSTFERIILQSLEQGNLQNQILDNPSSRSQEWLRAFLGGFFRLAPVKRALAGDALRSTFLSSMRAGARLQGRGWMLDL